MTSDALMITDMFISFQTLDFQSYRNNLIMKVRMPQHVYSLRMQKDTKVSS